MSYKLVDRVIEHTDATGAEWQALVVIAQRGHEDGVLADPRYPVDVLADQARLHRVTFSDALKALCAAGELVVFRGIGRGAVSVYGVLTGLDQAGRERVYETAWTRAAVKGGTYHVVDAGTLATDPKGKRTTTLYTGRKGSRSLQKGSVRLPFFSYKGFFPVSQTPEEERGLGLEDEMQTGRAASPPAVAAPRRVRMSHPPPPAQARTSEASRPTAPAAPLAGVQLELFQQLVGLGVFDKPAQQIAADLDEAWVRQVIAAGRYLHGRGNTPKLGATIVRMARGMEPLPRLAQPPTPAALASGTATTVGGTVGGRNPFAGGLAEPATAQAGLAEAPRQSGAPVDWDALEAETGWRPNYSRKRSPAEDTSAQP